MLATVVRHLMSDQVRFPVEGLGTLVTLIFPFFGVGQSVGLQTAGNAEHKATIRVCFVSYGCLAAEKSHKNL